MYEGTVDTQDQQKQNNGSIDVENEEKVEGGVEVEFVENKLEIRIRHLESPDVKALLRIQKTDNQYNHILVTEGKEAGIILQKPLPQYSPNRKESDAFSWLRDGVAPATSERVFREAIWERVINEARHSEAFREFQNEGVTEEIKELRDIVNREVRIKTLDDSKDQKVELHVDFQGRQETLILDTETVSKPLKVAFAFEKQYSHAPEAMYDIKTREWNKDVRIWLAKNDKVEHREKEYSEERFIANRVANGISNLRVVHQAKHLPPEAAEKHVYYDGNTVWVPTDAVHAERESNDISANLSQIKSWLKGAGYLKNRDKTAYRVQPKGPLGDETQCYPFDPELFSEEQLTESEEGDE